MKEGYQERKYPEKSWSISKMKTLNSCEREYYYTYYGSHNGWIYTSTDEQKLAWRLKKLTNLWMCFGDVVHNQIKGIINICKKDKTKFMNAIRFNEVTLNLLRNIVRESIQKYKTDEWNEYPKGTMLQEYYYGNTISKELGNELKERLNQCINSFYVSKSFEDILKSETMILENDEDVFSSIQYNSLKIYSKIDLLYKDTEGYYIIVDWKTGKPSDSDKEQLLVYAWYVMEQYGVHYSKIKGRIEYLLDGYSEELLFKYEDIEYIKCKVENDLKIINYYLDDINLNKAKEKIEFHKTDQSYKCKNCKFRLLCNKDNV
ncbi:PD-(D/E)XK nuclease family protein [Clostridioides difficile]